MTTLDNSGLVTIPGDKETTQVGIKGGKRPQSNKHVFSCGLMPTLSSSLFSST